MERLYNEAKMAWGACMPVQLKRLRNRDDAHVFEALKDVLNDILSETWTTDAKIAWRIMTNQPTV